MAPWVIKECIAQRFTPEDETWKHIFTPFLGIMESLHDSVEDRYTAMLELYAKQAQSSPDDSYSLDAMF